MQQQPWLQHYPDNVPHTINPDEFSSVQALFKQAVEKFPDHIALECFGLTLTYQQLDAVSDTLATAMQKELGIAKGDRVAVMLPNLFAYPISLLAILKTGAIQVNVNPLYTPRELEHQLNDSGAEHIIIYTGSTPALADIRDKTSIRNVITVGPGDGSGHDIPAPPVAENLGEHVALTELLARHDGEKPDIVELHGEDVLFLQYTGGTTGPSKGATLTHRNLVANTLQFKAFVPDANEPGKECVVLSLPMYHIFGLMIYVAYAAIGAKAILIPNPRDMDAYIGAIKNAGFTVIGGVNTLFAGMTMHPEFKNVDFSRYKVAFGGGSKIFPSTSERWHAVTGSHIIEGFGLSETAPILTLNLMSNNEFTGTVGYPVPSTDVKILGPDDQPLPPGEPGEICAKGPQVMKGYWNREQATAEVFTPDGYFRTGDVAVMHEDGKFEIVDRKKDMLIVSGFNVYPNEVEGVVCEMDSVAEAAVVGAPDEKTGERVKLFVSPSGKGELDEDAIIEHCRANLAAYKVPKEVVVLDEIPKSNVGKILRRNLR
ncbi:AMP-binding protein [Marinobacter sp. chi1]|uniref:Long-chain-fatty-acid--CoA ligase n=1 Tax=Marinobacter suaedae TaxID=3057675 RepID=A0ABT8VY96_9GAMM|nr:AMP-binding protein [Marinobacter sp. chi1]MDO3720969.1 AMP-binding protein [Marinobacter sp. chi1]